MGLARAGVGADRDQSRLGWVRGSAQYLGDGARYGVAILYSEEQRRARDRRRNISRLAALGPRTLCGGQRRHLYGFPVSKPLDLPRSGRASGAGTPTRRSTFGRLWIGAGTGTLRSGNSSTRSPALPCNRGAFFAGCTDGVFPMKALTAAFHGRKALFRRALYGCVGGCRHAGAAAGFERLAGVQF